MEKDKNINNEMLQLYSEQQVQDKINNITYLDNITFNPVGAMAEYVQGEVFLIEKTVQEEDKQLQIFELYMKKEESYLKIGNLTPNGIIFTDEYLEYIKNINELIFDTIKKQNGKTLEFDEKIMLEAPKMDKEKLEKLKTEKEKEENEEKEQESNELEIEKIAQKSGITAKELSSCSQISSTQKITDDKTFEDITHTKGQYSKVYVVNTDSKSKGTSRFAFWGVKNDGEVEQIPGLEERDGVNTGKEICSINRDGSEITKKQTAALFSLDGKEEGFSLTIGQYGIIETDYIRRVPEQGNKPLAIPVETSNQIYPTTKQVRKFMNNRLTNKEDLKNATTAANHQLDGKGEEVAEVSKTNLSQISNQEQNKSLNSDEIITLHDGSTTTISKEAQNLDVSLGEYKSKFEKIDGKCIADKIEMIREEYLQNRDERAREERLTPEEEALQRQRENEIREQMKK